MNFQAIELNVMFIWINIELCILAYAFFGFKIKRALKKLRGKHGKKSK